MDFALDTQATPSQQSATAHQEGWREEGVSLTKDTLPVIDRLIEAMMQAGYTGRDLFAARLAVDEALVNAIKHGHQSAVGGATPPVRLAYRIDSHQVLLVVEDQGPGFDPEQLPDPRAPERRERAAGRGVFLMQHYMTWVQFNDRGNRVTMCMRRS